MATLNQLTPDDRSEEQKEQDAIKHMDLLFEYFPVNKDFQIHLIIGQNVKENNEWRKVAKDQNRIEELMRRHDYAKTGTYNQQLRLTTKGEKAKEIGGHINYEQYQNFLNYGFMSPELKATCEAIFQLHKSNDYPIRWNKEIAKSLNPNYQTALACMVEQRIIFRDKENGATRTHLNAEYSAVNSYKEALKILEEKNKPAPTNFSGIYAPNNSGAVAQSSGDDNETNQRVKTTPNKSDKTHKRVIWYRSIVFKYIAYPVVAGLLILLIAYLIKHLHWQ